MIDKNLIYDQLHELGLQKHDTLFCHSNMTLFLSKSQNPQAVCQIFLEAILEVIGSNGTLVIPTFTYSNATGKTFDVKKTPSNCGYFAEYIREKFTNSRSSDPNVSVCVIGKLKSKIHQCDFKPYKSNGLFSILEKENAKVLNLNLDAGSTYIHHVERLMNVEYRFDKDIEGEIIVGGRNKIVNSSLYVRKLDFSGSEADFTEFHRISKETGAFKMKGIGRGIVGTISFKDTKSIIEDTISSNPYFLTRRSSL